MEFENPTEESIDLICPIALDRPVDSYQHYQHLKCTS